MEDLDDDAEEIFEDAVEEIAEKTVRKDAATKDNCKNEKDMAQETVSRDDPTTAQVGELLEWHSVVWPEQ
ncbi:unnamed protein product [Gongylonema pulchrum]|uniref:Pre-rRNA-processing protein TSR2 homolog n=1 Tax=Gongylonema pulchrum TaxID=637853 RepID=A0A183E1F9_9BILA|nr:unnamed protein product [Gongylonema pulchrum]